MKVRIILTILSSAKQHNLTSNHNLYAEKRFSTSRGGQQCLFFLLIQNILMLRWTQVYKYVQNLGRVAREVGVEVRCGARAEHLRMEVGSRKPSKMSSEFDINIDKYLTDPGINYFCWYVRDNLACLCYGYLCKANFV